MSPCPVSEAALWWSSCLHSRLSNLNLSGSHTFLNWCAEPCISAIWGKKIPASLCLHHRTIQVHSSLQELCRGLVLRSSQSSADLIYNFCLVHEFASVDLSHFDGWCTGAKVLIHFSIFQAFSSSWLLLFFPCRLNPVYHFSVPVQVLLSFRCPWCLIIFSTQKRIFLSIYDTSLYITRRWQKYPPYLV